MYFQVATFNSTGQPAAQKTFAISEKNLKEYEVLCKAHFELISKNIGEVNIYFMNACTSYARYFEEKQPTLLWQRLTVPIFENMHYITPAVPLVK